MSYQRTLAASAIVSGTGVHSGQPVMLRIRPAVADTGIRFMRMDGAGPDRWIHALALNVTTTELGTNLTNSNGVSVATVEHFLAACYGVGVDNIIAEVDGPELPILDGSAQPFVDLIKSAGVLEQSASRRVIRIVRPVEVRQGPKFARLSPGDGLELHVAIEFPTKAIGRQEIRFAMLPGAFERDIAWARTFGFASQAEQLYAMGKALGASMDNAVVIEGDSILNPEGLRASDEFVRHKMLDVIGDLFLGGGFIEGFYEGEQPGHALNNQLLRAVLSDPTAFVRT